MMIDIRLFSHELAQLQAVNKYVGRKSFNFKFMAYWIVGNFILKL